MCHIVWFLLWAIVSKIDISLTNFFAGRHLIFLEFAPFSSSDNHFSLLKQLILFVLFS